MSLSQWLLTTIGADWKTIDNPDLLIRWKSTNDHVDDKWVEIWNKGETWLTVFNLTFLTLFSTLPCFFAFFAYFFIQPWGATGRSSQLFKAL